jgi:hypothetical protein
VTVRGQSRHVVGYMKDFLFRPEQARTPVILCPRTPTELALLDVDEAPLKQAA